MQLVGTRIARDDIGQAVACAVGGLHAHQLQVLYVGSQGVVGQVALHRVRAFTCQLGHHIPRVVHRVGVVACAARELVSAHADGFEAFGIGIALQAGVQHGGGVVGQGCL